MKFLTRLFASALIAIILGSLAACSGSPPVTLNDIPTYPGATVLQPGQNPIADTLAQNVQQAGAMGAKLDQKIFTLPEDASWDQIKGFYNDKLAGAGWQSTTLPVPENDMFKMMLWTRSGQNLTVGQLTEPISKDTFLLFSLSSQ